MDPKTAKTVIPPFWKGVTRSKQVARQSFQLCSFDSETFFGKVFLSGFVYPNGEIATCYGLGEPHVQFLLDCLFSLPPNQGVTICGAHYMSFDLGVLFFEIVNPLGKTIEKAPRSLHFSLLSHRCEVEIFMGRPTFARIKKDGRTIHLIDTFAYFPMGLAAALKMLKVPVQKKKKPKDLGERLIPKAEIMPYFSADLLGGLALMREVERLHQKYEVKISISVSQLGGRILRRHYLKGDFPTPSKPLIIAGLLSYHGGKNTPPPKAGWYKDCWDIDINSAYLEAMKDLPDMEHSRWRLGKGLAFVRVHPHGVYKIAGTVAPCAWGCLFTHGFKKAQGPVKDLWVTGYELLEALRMKEIRLKSVRGYGIQAGFNPKREPSALSRFVADFFKLRSETTDPGLRYFYKVLPLSVYGKLIQRSPDEDVDGNTIRVAGSMFDPGLASLITGYVRAKIHRLEHKYNSIHTATDGIITQKEPDACDLGAGIGKLKTSEKVNALILRNKLYMLFDGQGNRVKSGLHGFQGNADKLEKLWKSSKRVYHVTHLTRWAEAWRHGGTPGKSSRQRRELLV